MDLLDRLRPRWRHPDPDVRAAAAREMGAADQERLAALADGDPDARVRRVAVKRVEDPAVLERVAASDPEPALRTLAAERLREVLIAIASGGGPLSGCEGALARLNDERGVAAVAMGGGHEAIRGAALARVGDERVLRDVVRGAADPAIRAAALARIRDPEMLRRIAAGDGPVEQALAALERIEDARLLRALADGRGVAKAVRQRARELLPADGEPAVDFKEGRARQLVLSTAVQALRSEPDVTRAAEQVRAAQAEWAALARAVPPRADVAEGFATACEAILGDAASLARRRADFDQERSAREESLAAHETLCERVEALDGADALAELTRAREDWNRLRPVSGERGAAVERRFARAGADCAARHGRWLAREALRREVEALVVEGETLAESAPAPAPKAWRALEKRWAAIDRAALPAEATAPLEQRFAAAGERLGQRRREAEQARGEEQRQNLARLEALCARLDEMAAAEGTKPAAARRELEAADAALADLGPLPAAERRAAWTERLTEGRAALLRRLREAEEAEEWRRFGNAGAQEEIIRRVEALLEANDLAAGVRQLGRLQDEWAAVATASADKAQALWERFRTARNELRRRCDAYLTENLEKKRALCARVADVGESTTWNDTAELVRRTQAEWKAIGPVPGKHAQALWQQFREPCDRFFARRKEYFDRLDGERRQIVEQKTALCEQVEALADSTDWETTATAIKQLQADWKRTGPLPRAQGDALWQRFRAACDRFFDRRNRREEIAREEAVGKAEAVADALAALAAAIGGPDAPATDEVGRRLDEGWAEWVRLDPGAGDAGRALAARVFAACERIAAASPESLRGTRLDPEATRKRREKLCARLEALVGTEAAAPSAPSLQEMALALRERLAANTIAGGVSGQTRRQDVTREAERLAASWAHLGPPLDAAARTLAERFDRALKPTRDSVSGRKRE